MKYLFVRQRVEDLDRRLGVFRSHADAHKGAGLLDPQVLQDVNHPDALVCFFRVEDMQKSLAFMNSPAAQEGRVDSGVIGEPEVLFLEEF